MLPAEFYSVPPPESPVGFTGLCFLVLFSFASQAPKADYISHDADGH